MSGVVTRWEWFHQPTEERTDESNKVGKPNESTTTQKKPMLPVTPGLVSITVKRYVLDFYF